jgi:hypothetical protein
MERDILKKRRPSLPRSRHEVPLHRRTPQPVAGEAAVPGPAGHPRRFLHLAGPSCQCPTATAGGLDDGGRGHPPRVQRALRQPAHPRGATGTRPTLLRQHRGQTHAAARHRCQDETEIPLRHGLQP